MYTCFLQFLSSVPPETLQLGFCHHHSTEIALVKVRDDFHIAKSSGHSSSFILAVSAALTQLALFFLNSFLTGLSGKQPLVVLFFLYCQFVRPPLLISSCLSSLLMLESPRAESSDLFSIITHSLNDLTQFGDLKCPQYLAYSHVSLSSLDL